MNDNNVDELQKGSDFWNLWRKQNPKIRPDLRNVNFTSSFPSKLRDYGLPLFENTDFSNCDLHGVILRNGSYINCNFDRSDINWADFVDAYFEKCSFRNVSMRVSKIGSANFRNCIFENSDLSYCSAEETSFIGSIFINTRLEHMSLVKCDLENTKIENCFVYGTSTWDLNLNNSIQENIIITDDENDVISVDNLELAQFIYLLINNSKLRHVIETITSKVVLIL